VLLSFIGLSLIWTIIFLSVFFAEQPKLERGVSQRATAVTAMRTPGRLVPAAVTPSAVTVIQRDGEHVDLLAFVENTNEHWGVQKLKYHFTLGDRSLEEQEVFLNPKTERPLIQLNIAQTGAAPAGLVLDEVEWVRAGTAVIPLARFSTDRLELTPTTVSTGQHSVATMNLRAILTNRSVYSFLRIEVPIIVMSGSTVVAVDMQTLDRWPTLTNRVITSTWPYPIAAADSARLDPQVSQFDSTNLFPGR
jgi:hypothetical protein